MQLGLYTWNYIIFFSSQNLIIYYILLQNWQKPFTVKMYRNKNLSCLLLRSQLGRSIVINPITRPRRMYAVHGCGLLLQMWPGQYVCLSVCPLPLQPSALQNGSTDRGTVCGIDSCWPRNPVLDGAVMQGKE